MPKDFPKIKVPQAINDQAVSLFSTVYRFRPVMAGSRQLIPSIWVLDVESYCSGAERTDLSVNTVLRIFLFLE